jgi:hypothetical protein
LVAEFVPVGREALPYVLSLSLVVGPKFSVLLSNQEDDVNDNLFAQHREPPALSAYQPLNISPWLAMSLMQKAIRRGREEIALRAAATLLRDSPDRLWRRCGITVFEDIGVADLDVVAEVTAALSGKTYRSRIGGEWAVAATIISRMTRATKCRAADDLLTAAEGHPLLESARQQLWQMPTAELIRLAAGTAPLPERAIALWYLLGTNPRTSSMRERRGEPQVAFEGMRQAGLPESVLAIAREGYRKLREPLTAAIPLLQPLMSVGQMTIEDDPFGPETVIGEVPSWAYDVHTREGRAALQRFLPGTSETARWVRAHIPTEKRLRFLGSVVFRIESGLVRSRLRWPTGDALRNLVDEGCSGRLGHASEILELMRRDLPQLNEVRANVR